MPIKMPVGEVVNAYTSLDEMMQGNGPIMLLSPKQMFEMGQFYQWVAMTLIDGDDEADLESRIEVPEEFSWVVGETQGW